MAVSRRSMSRQRSERYVAEQLVINRVQREAIWNRLDDSLEDGQESIPSEIKELIFSYAVITIADRVGKDITDLSIILEQITGEHDLSFDLRRLLLNTFWKTYVLRLEVASFLYEECSPINAALAPFRLNWLANIQRLDLCISLHHPDYYEEYEHNMVLRGVQAVRSGRLLNIVWHHDEDAAKLAKAMPSLRTIFLSCMPSVELSKDLWESVDVWQEEELGTLDTAPFALETIASRESYGILRGLVRCTRKLLAGRSYRTTALFELYTGAHQNTVSRVDLLEGNVDDICKTIVQTSYDGVHTAERMKYEENGKGSCMSD